MKIIAATALIMTLSASAWAGEAEATKQIGGTENMKPVASRAVNAPVVLTQVQLDAVTGGAAGTVKWFNPTKGYGFIEPDGGGR